MDIDLSIGAVGCESTAEGENGAFAGSAHYNAVSEPREVRLSTYMGTVMVAGAFGNMFALEGITEAEYEAVQVHLAAPSLHTINGQSYDAEMLVMHRPKNASDLLDKSIIFSIMFSDTPDQSSAVFEAMGFGKDGGFSHAGATVWDSEGVIDVSGPVDSAFQGAAYLYNGSVPVPPCSETVKWVVFGSPQAVSPKQTAALRSLLSEARDGAPHRRPVARAHDRCVAVNSRQVGGHHKQATCEADHKKGVWQRSAQCWEVHDRCWAKRHSAVDIQSDDAMEPDSQHPQQDINDLVRYKAVDTVRVAPSLYTLDAFVPDQGNFGYLLLNGHIFFAKNVTFKAVSQHTINGRRAEGELVIEHVMFGDMMGHSLPESELHKVMVSIPLAKGPESPLLRKLNLRASTSRTIRHGLSYDVQRSIDLKADLQDTLKGRWFWYSSNSTHRDCGPSVRWMVFETPLTISMEQLNYLALPVSGVDSSHVPYPVPRGSFWRQHLPAAAVEANETECKNLMNPEWAYGDSSPHWDYGNERCWEEEYPICGAGRQQSPIDIPTGDHLDSGTDNFLAKCSWKPVEGLRVENTGHGVQVSSEQFGYMTFINDKGFPDFYQVAQFHIHMPSEHMIGGKQYAAELHIVHKRQNTVLDLANDDLLVTAILFDFGEESPILKQMFLPNTSAGLKSSGSYKTMTRPFDPMWAFGPVIDGPFFRYDGSLTTPPCAEVVKWFVFEKTMTLSMDQWSAFKALYPNPSNNRPIQPLNGRKVARNSFQQGSPVTYRFFLNREMGRNRMARTPPEFILFPIGGTVLLMLTIMAATFMRQRKKWQDQSAGGLAPTTIGAAEYAPL